MGGYRPTVPPTSRQSVCPSNSPHRKGTRS
nr:MAG TPA: hypothetical protein [Caudoviricetes sp.]